MAKIGIITYHFVPNYGAVMQAWGLQKFLRSLGHEIFFIDYRPSHLTTGGSFWWPTDSWHLRANIVIFYQKAMSARHALLGDGGKAAEFAEFQKRFLNISEQTYHSLKELRHNPPDAEAFICGSDQIWNASKQFGIDPAYFLAFGSSETRRISYAASFGRPFVEQRFCREYTTLLSRLDAISVRESSGVDLINDLTGRDAFFHPDPTLLVEDGYPEAKQPNIDSTDYLFSYTLRSREDVGEVEEQIALHKGLTIVSPETIRASRKRALGPLEWLGFIKSAKFVVTNSYHGTLFSIMFRKPFIFVGLGGEKIGFNERAISLLKQLGLTEHIIYGCDHKEIDVAAELVPDWERVHGVIASWRKEAQRYLEKALSGSNKLS